MLLGHVETEKILTEARRNPSVCVCVCVCVCVLSVGGGCYFCSVIPQYSPPLRLLYGRSILQDYPTKITTTTKAGFLFASGWLADCSKDCGDGDLLF